MCVYEVLFSLSLNAMGVIEDDWEVFKPSLSDLLASFAKLLCVCAFEKEREDVFKSSSVCVYVHWWGYGGRGAKDRGGKNGLVSYACLCVS